MSTVHCHIFNPSTALFKSVKNDRAECTTIECSLPTCPLLAAGTCMLRPAISWTRCPYGKVAFETGFTRRASGFSSWIRERKEKYEGVPCLEYPAQKLAFVGDYVYLPYPHMDMNESVPFLAHGGAFRKSECLLRLSDWTIENVAKIVTFRPHALMGGVIKDYQEKSVPKFLSHLREECKGMWVQLVEWMPELDTPPNWVGRKALLKTLRHGIKWTTSGGHRSSYPVTWHWDGERVRTSSKHAYDATWGDVKFSEFELSGTPAEDATVVVASNDWVCEETVFVD